MGVERAGMAESRLKKTNLKNSLLLMDATHISGSFKRKHNPESVTS